jgi:hypothetical protein
MDALVDKPSQAEENRALENAGEVGLGAATAKLMGR